MFLHFDSSRLLICCGGHDSAFKTAKILSVAISDRVTYSLKCLDYEERRGLLLLHQCVTVFLNNLITGTV